MPAGKASRLAFFRGVTSEKGYGYQPDEDRSLPVCWLERVVAVHYAAILDDLQDPEKLYIVQTSSGAPGAFFLDKVSPTFRSQPLVPDSYVQPYARYQAKTLEEILIEQAPEGLGAIEYISKGGTHSVGMRFAVDEQSNVKDVYYLRRAELRPGILTEHPDLEKVLLGVLGSLVNTYTESMREGLLDDCAHPFAWRTGARSEIYALSPDTFAAVNISRDDAIDELEKSLSISSRKRL